MECLFLNTRHYLVLGLDFVFLFGRDGARSNCLTLTVIPTLRGVQSGFLGVEGWFLYRASRVPTELFLADLPPDVGPSGLWRPISERLRSCRAVSRGLGASLALCGQRTFGAGTLLRPLPLWGGCFRLPVGSWYNIRWKVWLARSSSVTGRITSINFPQPSRSLTVANSSFCFLARC